MLPGLAENFARAGLPAGIDEAGRGCLAGPVVAAAVILPSDSRIVGLADSKTLSPEKRSALATEIKISALAFAVGLTWPRVIDRINILQATFLAMSRAVRALEVAPGFLLIDGNHTIPVKYLSFAECERLPQEAVIKGDSKVAAISAASIVAKTFRDDLMTRLDHRYPGYGFAVHKGYGVAAHLEALKTMGPSRLHRLSFRGVLPQKPTLEQGRLW